MGIKAVHVWRLEPRGAGTLVVNEESWDGIVARLLRRSLQKALNKANTSWLERLKIEADRRTKPRA
jgi:hypothetical protein